MTEVLLFHHAQGRTPGVLAFADKLREAGHTVHVPDLYEGQLFDDLEADEGEGMTGSTGFVQTPVVCFSMQLSRPEVHGIDLDAQTRCAHYRTALDIIAIRMKCCGVYYACRECHEALAGHPIEVWPQAEWNQPAVLCGACGYQLSIAQYMASGYKCPNCDAAFNPGCRKHYEFYFATAE